MYLHSITGRSVVLWLRVTGVTGDLHTIATCPPYGRHIPRAQSYFQRPADHVLVGPARRQVSGRASSRDGQRAVQASLLERHSRRNPGDGEQRDQREDPREGGGWLKSRGHRRGSGGPWCWYARRRSCCCWTSP